MSRPLHIEVPNGIFHATSRGIARRTIFHDDTDRRIFLFHLRHTVMRHRWRCIAFCLMPNHFHLLVQTPKANLSDGMRDLKSGYVSAYNSRRGEDGSRLKARFWRQLIQEDGYLLAAAAYVVLNPVRAGLVADPADWPWSSYSATVAGDHAFLDPRPVLRLFDADPTEARRRFAELASNLAGLPAYDPSVPIVGDDAFIEEHAPGQRPPRYVSQAAWFQARPSLAELSSRFPGTEFIREACGNYRYTRAEVAAHLGCSERTISRRLQMARAGTRPL